LPCYSGTMPGRIIHESTCEVCPAREISLVIPGHGARRYPALIPENRAYLRKSGESAVNAMESKRDSGGDIDIPLEACLAGGSAAAGDVYLQAHGDNCARACEYPGRKPGFPEKYQQNRDAGLQATWSGLPIRGGGCSRFAYAGAA